MCSFDLMKVMGAKCFLTRIQIHRLYSTMQFILNGLSLQVIIARFIITCLKSAKYLSFGVQSTICYPITVQLHYRGGGALGTKTDGVVPLILSDPYPREHKIRSINLEFIYREGTHNLL